jgi:hypothetical protein
MSDKPDLFREELDQLSDQEIEARLAAAVWAMTSVRQFCATLKRRSWAGRKRPILANLK